MNAGPPPLGMSPVFGRLVQPLLSRWRGERWHRYVGTYTRHFRRSRQALRDRQLEDLRSLLVHAQAACPFYTRRFAEAGFDPARIQSLEDLRRIPTLARADVLAHVDDMISTRHDRAALWNRKTGGTTNVPIAFFQDTEAIHRKKALSTVIQRSMGWHEGMRQAWIWGAAQDKPAKDREPLHALKEDTITRHVERILDLDAGDMPPSVCDAHLETLARWRPHLLQGYPVATDLVAQRALERGIRLDIPLVVLTAEPVLPAHRERIGEAFGANVLSFYGSRENGWIAHDHPETKEMLINTAGVVLESDPETQEFFVTDLLNRGMPLIRYEIGDRGTISDAPTRCGDPRPTVTEIHGRTADVVILPSGRRIPGVIYDYRGLVLDPEGLVDVQLVQTDLHHMEIRYVPGPKFKQEALDVYVARMSRMCMDELEMTTTAVERIAPEPNGKVRCLISHVEQP